MEGKTLARELKDYLRKDTVQKEDSVAVAVAVPLALVLQRKVFGCVVESALVGFPVLVRDTHGTHLLYVHPVR